MSFWATPLASTKGLLLTHMSPGCRGSYAIANTYRDAPNTTGFTLSFPATISVAANGSANFTVSATVSAASLPTWTLDGGPDGGNGELLNSVEYADRKSTRLNSSHLGISYAV